MLVHVLRAVHSQGTHGIAAQLTCVATISCTGDGGFYFFFSSFFRLAVHDRQRRCAWPVTQSAKQERDARREIFWVAMDSLSNLVCRSAARCRKSQGWGAVKILSQNGVISQMMCTAFCYCKRSASMAALNTTHLKIVHNLPRTEEPFLYCVNKNGHVCANMQIMCVTAFIGCKHT